MAIKIDTTKLGLLDRIIPGCKVVSIPAGASPKFVVVELPRADGARISAYYYGFPTLSVNDYVRIQRRGADNQYDIVGTDRGTASSASGVAPADAQYVTLATDVTLTAERVLVAGSGLVLTDGGAGGNATLDIDITELTEDTTPDAANDYTITYDASGTANKKVKLENLPSGGGFNHTYLGYNTAGGSSEAMVATRVYMKKITVSEAGVLLAIGVYITHASPASNVQSIACWVMSDDAGTPDLQIALGPRWAAQTFFLKNEARWLDLPVGIYLPAGDYWLCVQRPNDPGSDLHIYYDGSGTDKYQDTESTGWSSDGSSYTVTDTTNRYSIRGSLIY